MAEALRNEVEIELAGEPRVMRATFSAIRAIEKDTGKGIVGIIQEAAGGRLSVTDIATIIYRGLGGNGDTRLTYEQVGDAVVANGIEKPSVAAVEFLMQALNGASLGKSEAGKAA